MKISIQQTTFFVALAFLFVSVPMSAQNVPTELVNVHKEEPTIQVELKYLGENNFLGRRVAGYKKNVCYLSKSAAKAAAQAQKELLLQGYSLKMYDCTRPQRAVDDFVKWASDLADQKTKSKFYPLLEKSKLFELGYIAKKSGHSRGSTIDVTVVRLNGKKFEDVDMGSAFDFFGEISHTEHANISENQKKNRLILKMALQKQGFKNFKQEWWHYTLVPEEFPKKYFDFDVE